MSHSYWKRCLLASCSVNAFQNVAVCKCAANVCETALYNTCVMCMTIRVCVYVCFSPSVWPFKRFLQGRGGREDNGSRHYLLLSCRLNIRAHTVWPSPTRTANRCTCAHAPTRRVHGQASMHLCRNDARARNKVKKGTQVRPQEVPHRKEINIKCCFANLNFAAGFLNGRMIFVFAFIAHACMSPLLAWLAALMCKHALFLVCNLATVRCTVHTLLIYTYIFFLHASVHVVGEDARIQVPQSVRQHFVRQASVMAPQGKAAYCGHEPWWLSLLGGVVAHAHSRCQTRVLHCICTCTHVCTGELADA